MAGQALDALERDAVARRAPVAPRLPARAHTRRTLPATALAKEQTVMEELARGNPRRNHGGRGGVRRTAGGTAGPEVGVLLLDRQRWCALDGGVSYLHDGGRIQRSQGRIRKASIASLRRCGWISILLEYVAAGVRITWTGMVTSGPRWPASTRSLRRELAPWRKVALPPNLPE